MNFFSKKRIWVILIALLVAVCGCASKDTDSKNVSPPKAHAIAKSEDSRTQFSYMRVARTNAASVELYVACRKLVPIKGKKPEIWLVAATHIGESNYYHDLQRHLDNMTLVLFEGIRMYSTNKKTNADLSNPISDDFNKNSLHQTFTQSESDKISKDIGNSIQFKLAKSLGLAFQLEAIDYSKPNFKNCDMDITQLEEILANRKPTSEGSEEVVNEEWEKLKGLYLGDSIASMVADLLLRLIGSSPRMVALTKIALIETISKVEGDIGRWEGIPESMQELLNVLIAERNKIIISKLKKVIPQMKKGDTIALFYGAAHMQDLETRIRSEFGYKPSGEIWYKAFGVDTSKYGISEFEINLLKRIIDNTIKQMKEK